jgi:soluble lytic murein transglycosylase-like protein
MALVYGLARCVGRRPQRHLIYGFAGLLLCLSSLPAAAEIYRYRDQRGHSIFTDKPMPNRGYTLVWRSGRGNIQSSASRVPKRPAKSVTWKDRKQYEGMIRSAATKAQVSQELLHAVVQAESAYNAQARSSAGAMGLMQLMPGTAERYGVADVWDPAQNLEGGARYLRDLLDRFKNNLKLALAAYNAGEGAVIKYGNRIPPYPETRDYVRKVIAKYLSERQRTKS